MLYLQRFIFLKKSYTQLLFNFGIIVIVRYQHKSGFSLNKVDEYNFIFTLIFK